MLGTIGILIQAKKMSLIDCLKEELDQLKYQANFRISEVVYQQALSEVDEAAE